jgi:hypothetical protein
MVCRIPDPYLYRTHSHSHIICFVCKFLRFREPKLEVGALISAFNYIFFVCFYAFGIYINSPAPVDPEQRGEGEASDPEVPVRR